MKIEKVETINGDPVVEFIIRGWIEMLDAGLLTERFIPISWDEKAFVAKDRGKIIGAISYRKSEWYSTLDIHIGYVLPTYRRKGVYTKLWSALVGEAKALNMRRIDGGTSANNRGMDAFNRSVGRKLASRLFRFEVSQCP